MITYIKIDGITCNNCKETIKKSLLKIKNIKKVEFNKSVAVVESKTELDREKIIKVINELNYFTKEENFAKDIKKLKKSNIVKEFIIITLIIILSLFILNKIFGFNIFNMIPTIDNSITYGMLFITGICTSIHCISMCGAINLLTAINKNKKTNLKKPILYNLGRLISYTVIGGIIGLIGSILSINKTIQSILLLISAIIMILISLDISGIIEIRKIKVLKHKTKSTSPFIIGLLNGLMPCGPLQAMQIYALSTGSFIKGALSMFMFCLGIIPLMLTIGIAINLVKGKLKLIINKVTPCLIFLLSLFMLNQALTALNINIFKQTNNDKYIKSTIKDTYQIVKIDLDYDNYKDIIIQNKLKTKLIIHVDKDKLTGCNNEIIIDKLKIKKELKPGDNIIEFTPEKQEDITYTCWMNMIKNTIRVIDNKNYFKEKRQ